MGSTAIVSGQAQRHLSMPSLSYVIHYEAFRGPILTRAEEEALKSDQYYCQDVSIIVLY